MKNILDSSRYANGATSAHANVSEENFSESWSYVTATFPFWVEEEDSRFVRHSLTRFTFDESTRVNVLRDFTLWAATSRRDVIQRFWASFPGRFSDSR